MKYNLIRTFKGKKTVMMTDDLPAVNKRLKALRASHRGKGVSNSAGTGKRIFHIEKVEKDL